MVWAVCISVALLSVRAGETRMGYDDQTEMGGRREAFLTTQWSLIDKIQANEDRDRALTGFLLEQYWKPVYCYLRRKGHDNERAKDLTQGFFHEVVLSRDLVGRADATRGRFRAFLLHALNQYVAKQNLKDHAAKRIPRHKLVSLDVVELPVLPERVANASAEEAYHYAWLSALLERVVAQVGAECVEEGLKIHWKLFQRASRGAYPGQPSGALAGRSLPNLWHRRCQDSFQHDHHGKTPFSQRLAGSRASHGSGGGSSR